MSAVERREEVLRAALHAFAQGGYEGTSAAQIADRVGVSQPYLFRLFPGKRALFVAAVERCFDEVHAELRDAAGGLYGQDAIIAMRDRYRELLADSTLLQFQLQIFAAAAGDEEIRVLGHDRWAGLWRAFRELSGEPAEEIMRFVAAGMLTMALTALDVPHTPGPDLGRSLHEWSTGQGPGRP